MSRRARLRSQHPRRHHLAAVNAVQIAINGARKLSAEDVDGHVALITRAYHEYITGSHCADHWCSLADTCGMARTLAGMGLGSGIEADSIIDRANVALKDAHDRHATRGTWALYADEIEALHWLIRLHTTQLRACSYSEFARAFDLTAERARQSLAGNAAPGATVTVGQFGTHHREQGNARSTP